jgi:pSer/pThr/pTyr-binding forkhead associated (FHA) protein
LARSAFFGAPLPPEPMPTHEGCRPGWLAAVRHRLTGEGHWIAYEDDDDVQVFELREEWTRIGRSLAADIRFDDPTVSRRHALVHREEWSVRVLDDRSLNGVFLNGERVEWQELADGDEIVIGRFRLHFLSTLPERLADGAPRVRTTIA